MKILCLTDFPVKAPDRWIWSYLPDQPDEVDFLSAEAPDRSAAWGKLVTRYPAYYRLALRALAQLARKQYDLVVAWEASIGVPFALAARWHRGRVPPLVVLVFNPGDVPLIFRPLVHLGARTIDHLTVQTPTEAAAYARQFALPPARITVTPLPSYDLYPDMQRQAVAHPYNGQPYIHASGRSGRDYATLVKAVAGLNVKTVIHGRGYNFQGLEIPPNVEMGEFASRAEFHRLVYHALFEVVPLQPHLRPIGASQVVFAMMMGKPVVATHVISLGDIVEEGVTGLLSSHEMSTPCAGRSSTCWSTPKRSPEWVRRPVGATSSSTALRPSPAGRTRSWCKWLRTPDNADSRLRIPDNPQTPMPETEGLAIFNLPFMGEQARPAEASIPKKIHRPLLNTAFVDLNIRHSPFAIRHSSFAIRHSSFAIRHSTFHIEHHLPPALADLRHAPVHRGPGKPGGPGVRAVGRLGAGLWMCYNGTQILQDS